MKKSISICILLLFSFALKAGWENPVSKRFTPISSPDLLAPMAVIDVMDNKFSNPFVSGWDNGMLNNNVLNKIVLGIDVNQGGGIYYSAYTITAQIQIEAWDASGTAITPIITTLSLSYDPTIGAKEDLRAIYTLSGYHRVKVTVIDIQDQGNSSYFPDHIYVENFIQVERFYTVSPTSTGPLSSFASNISHNGSSLGGEELEVTWGIPSASEVPEAYELEWTYSQEYQENVGTSPVYEYKFSVDFKNNGTNIITQNTSYKIPLIYEKGLLMWRVRAIYYDHNDLSTPKYTEWSHVDNYNIYKETGSSTLKDEGLTIRNNTFIVDGFSPGKNWQYSISFAEEGKNKASISYYDGALKSRQSLTRVNSDGNTLVGQTIYDFNGRPAIQVLPVPVIDDLSLSYREAFNKSAVSGNPAYTWEHFDVDANSVNCIKTKTHAMTPSSGSSQYYSSSSPLTSSGVSILGRDRIPQAEGYPFVQTEYSPDNTGRVRRQGGVGLKHRLTGLDEASNSLTGHESKYFYGTPSGQEELDRLFGNEIGSYKHYKKNMIIDPNGQISISYLDPQGRVVASALAGDGPSNVDPLSGSIPAEELWVTYENTEFDYNDYSLATHREILVEKDGVYDFYYKVTSPKYTDQCLPVGFCFDCIYDLELSIKNECGEDLVTAQNLKYLSGFLTETSTPVLNTSCADSVILELRPTTLGGTYEPFSLTLPVGKYTIYKKLTVNKEALEYYKKEFIDNLITGENCLKSLQDFVTEEKAKLDYTRCNYTCAQCYIDAGQDAEKIAQCDEFCEEKDQCYGLYIQMKHDMSPGGQYFDNINQSFIDEVKGNGDPNDDDIDLADDPFPITYSGSGTGINDWLERRAPISSSVEQDFFTDFNTRFAVGGIAQFTDWDDIRARWQPEFAEELAKLHPEYCYYEKCLDIQESYKYDQKLIAITNGSDAVALGYFNPLQMTSPDVNTTKYPSPSGDNKDPFFFDGAAQKSPEWGLMRAKLLDYDGLGKGSVWTLVDNVQTNPGASAVEVGSQAAGGCLSDYDWYFFRALYLAEKQKMYKAYYQTACSLDIPVVTGGETKNELIDDVVDLYSADPEPSITRKTRRFYSDAAGAFSNFGITIPPATNDEPFETIKTKTINFCKDKCFINADMWMDELKGCKFSSSDLTLLKDELILICENSCDEGSEFGASSSSVYTPNGNRTFEDAVNWIIIKGGYNKSDICNSHLIQFPSLEKPHQPAMVPLDACACTKIDANALDYTTKLANSTLPTGICSEAELFTYTYDVSIDDLQLLKCLCANGLSKNATPISPSATDLCYNTYGLNSSNCSSGISEKGVMVDQFTKYLISNINQLTGATDFDATSIPTITNARNLLVQGFFGANSLLYPNGGDPNCIPQISFGAISSSPPTLTRQIFISDNCGFSCTLTVALTTSLALTNFAQMLNYWDVSQYTNNKSATASSVTIAWTEPSASMTVSASCFTDLDCPTDRYRYPEAFVPATIACAKCLTCEELTIKYNNFKLKHPYLLEPQASSELIVRFKDYLNFDLNYNYTLEDINDLLKQCTENTTCSLTTAATALKALLDKMILRKDLGKTTVDLNNIDYPELYNPAIYTGSSGNSPQIKNNHPFVTLFSTISSNETVVNSGGLTYTITHPADVIDGVLYPIMIKIVATVTTTENTVIYVGDSLGGGKTIIIPPLNVGDEYYVYTFAMPYFLAGSPNGTVLHFNANYLDAYILELITLPFGTTLINFDPTANEPKNSFTITDNNGFDCTIKFDLPDGLASENIESIESIFPDPLSITGSNVMKALVIMKGSTEPIEVFIHSTCHNLTSCGTLSTGISKCESPLDFTEPDPCTERLDRQAEDAAWVNYNLYIQNKLNEFEKAYLAHCMQPFEYFGSSFIANPYQITLYYYDQADNLIKTVPPNGVEILDQTAVNSCREHRNNPTLNPRILTDHKYITHYQYNTLNQLIEQYTPDAGTAKFWYDRLGRMVLSQNAKQINNNHYSYTRYDAIGRITEVGELTTTATLTATDVATDAWLSTTINNAISTATQITKTFYDDVLVPASTIPNFAQQNLRKRVVTTAYYENYEADNLNYTNATHFTYDVTGNVNQLVQENTELERFQQQYKTLHYNYDLISGNVNMVAYQPGELDQFYHHYTYDEDNRLTATYTSRITDWNLLQGNNLPDIPNNPDWVLEAKQFFYKHGPMVRTEIGEQQVQGLDYAYTIHGWLKAINSTFGTAQADGNEDGYGTTTFQTDAFAQDAFGFELGYYNGDYNPIGTKLYNVIATKTGSALETQQTSLYNGNISYSVTSLPDSLAYRGLQMLQQPKASMYRYDQLNRLTKSLTVDLAADNITTNTWQSGSSTVANYEVEQINYDKNGNILALKRRDEFGAYMDNLAYTYDITNPIKTNRLLHVDDAVLSTNHYEDIDDQSANNYAYDAIGNLIQDNAEEIATIEWTVYGKVKSITRTIASLKPDLEFTYNAAGIRISKKVIPKNGDNPTITYYTHDASGNIMATYTFTDGPTPTGSTFPYAEKLKLNELYVYGSRRIGVLQSSTLLTQREYITDPESDGIYTFETYQLYDTTRIKLGYKNYELNNHLGNVLATITDRKIAYNNGSGNINHYIADIASVTDYYPFGMRIEKRSWSINKYRFGFNGKERDDEAKGGGNSLDFGARIYDSRLGRFLSIDPKFYNYPYWSPYCFAANSPIKFIDANGEGPIDPTDWKRYSSILWFGNGTFIVSGKATESPHKYPIDNSVDKSLDYWSVVRARVYQELESASGTRSDEQKARIKSQDHFVEGDRPTDIDGQEIGNAGTNNPMWSQGLAYYNASKSGNYNVKVVRNSGNVEFWSVESGIVHKKQIYRVKETVEQNGIQVPVLEKVKTITYDISYKKVRTITKRVPRGDKNEGYDVFNIDVYNITVTEKIKNEATEETTTKTYKHEEKSEPRFIRTER